MATRMGSKPLLARRAKLDSKSEPDQLTPERRTQTGTPRDAFLETERGPLDELYLLGHPPLDDYLRYVRKHVIDGDQKRALKEWRRANEYRQNLEASEAGIADAIEVSEIDSSLDALAAELISAARYRNTYEDLPGRLQMVELDRLVISQFHVVPEFARRQRARLGVAPDAKTVFRFCHPPEGSMAPVKARRVGDQRYIFSSESTDFRPHGPVLLRPDQLRGYETYGPISHVVGLVVGFGPNYLSAVRHKGRLVLHNGYHRAYALRDAGITHAPCVVKTAADADELEVAAGRSVRKDKHFYFESDRPPVLKDFFDPNIAKPHRIRRTVSMIEIEFEIREYTVES